MITPKCFGKNISELVVGRYMGSDNFFGLNTFSDKMAVDFNVFCPLMIDWMSSNV